MMSDLSAFHGPNAGYVLDLYDRYLQDPSSVDPDSASGSPDEKPSNSTISTRGCR